MGQLETELVRYGARAIVSSLEVRGYEVELERSSTRWTSCLGSQHNSKGRPQRCADRRSLTTPPSMHIDSSRSYFDCIDMIRARSEKKSCNYPSVSGWWLTRWAGTSGT